MTNKTREEKIAEMTKNIGLMFENSDFLKSVDTPENRAVFLDAVLNNSIWGDIEVEMTAYPTDVDTWLQGILESNDRKNMLTFKDWYIEKLYEDYPDYADEAIEYFMERLKSYFSNNGYQEMFKAINECKYEYDKLYEALTENDIIRPIADINIPNVKVNIVFATDEEINQSSESIPYLAECVRDDYAAENFLDEPELAHKMYDNAMTYFLASQDSNYVDVLGYGKNDEDGRLSYPPPKNLNTEDQFRYDARLEMEELAQSDYLGMLTTLAKTTPDKLFEILNSPSLQISKNSIMGLYDPYNGAGGPFGISLKKDAILPTRLINLIEVEEGNSRSTANSTYGFSSIAWQGEIKACQEAPAINMDEGLDKFRAFVKQKINERTEEDFDVSP